MTTEVEQGFTAEQTQAEVERCLNCDMETHFIDVAVHRVRRVHRHLPGRLPDDHANARRAGPARAASARRPTNLEQPLFVSGR